MSTGFEILDIQALRPLLDRRQVIECVRAALIHQANGKVQSPPPGQLLFRDPPGDCHIKYAHVHGSDTFAIKIASGFYENTRRNLPTNQGLIVMMDAYTGVPRVLLKDDGWLTAWRTAAAGALAAATLAPVDVDNIGIVGTGLQAQLAIEWLPVLLGHLPILVWGRDSQKAQQLAARCATPDHRVRSAKTLEELLAICKIILTATPSANPLFTSAEVLPGTHLIGVGADGPGKQELPHELFARAAHVLTDDHAQCLDHGDFGNAVRAGTIKSNADVMIGRILSGQIQKSRQPADITIVDLTGIAAEDIAIAELFFSLHAASCASQARDNLERSSGADWDEVV